MLGVISGPDPRSRSLVSGPGEEIFGPLERDSRVRGWPGAATSAGCRSTRGGAILDGQRHVFKDMGCSGGGR